MNYNRYSRKNLNVYNVRKTSKTKKVIISILVALGLIGAYLMVGQGEFENHKSNSTECTLNLSK